MIDMRGWTTAGCTLLLLAGSAAAQDTDKIGRRLNAYEGEVRDLRGSINAPDQLGKPRTVDLVSRRIVDAEVNFGVGNYDDAAVVLYDVVKKHKKHPSWDEALYYLAESLFQKKDFVGSQKNFARLAREVGGRSKFYQQGLQRLVELALKLENETGAEEWLSLLDKIPQGSQKTSVPYVRGKYAFFRDDYAKAMTQFRRVPRTSKYFLQSRYFVASIHIARRDLKKAHNELGKIAKQKPLSSEGRRVVELSHMALGRVFYELGQLSRAIDHYQKIPRQSDLLDEVLYETSWVYVKNRDFTRALQTLELLELTDPSSAKLPDVRILEGNLRIRKAKARVENGEGDGQREYDQAVALFDSLRGTYGEPHSELKRIIAEQADPRLFVAQITGRSADAFDTKAPLPEVAIAWLRQEPGIERTLTIENDLADIDEEIQASEKTILRLERALNSPARVNAFPSLADKRSRAMTIGEDIDSMQLALSKLAQRQLAGAATAQDKKRLGSINKQRRQLAAELKNIPGATSAPEERRAVARGQYDSLDQTAAETRTVLENTRAELKALKTYLNGYGAKNLKPSDIKELNAEIDKLSRSVKAHADEVDHTRHEVMLANDLAGQGDASSLRARELREQLRTLVRQEAALYRDVAQRGGTNITRIQELFEQSLRIARGIAEVNSNIDRVVDAGLVEVRAALEEEKAQLAAYSNEFTIYEAESRDLGGEVIGQGFVDVERKLSDILIRSDAGVADVAWSQHESADERARRLAIDEARERKTLDADFADVLRTSRRGSGGNP